MSAQIELVNEAAFPLDEARLKAVAGRGPAAGKSRSGCGPDDCHHRRRICRCLEPAVPGH